MYSIQELQQKSNEIDFQVKELRSKDPNLLPLTDGIINIEKYFSSRYRILWILKEPYYDNNDESGNPVGENGGYDLKDTYNRKKSITDFNKKTFESIIKVSWGLLNDFQLVEKIDSNNEECLIEAFKSIAYINVKKIQGGRTSKSSLIEKAYTDNKNILLKQIDYYNPNIIIGGNVLYLFLNDLGIKKEEMINLKSLKYVVKNKRILIEAYHPANFKIPRKVYCNDIISLVKLLS